MISRSLTTYESWFASTIQSAVELRTPQLATQFVDYIVRSISSFRLRRDGNTLSVVNSPPTIASIPSHLKTSRDVCIWGDEGLRPFLKDRLAAIAIRDSHVVLSINHLCFDGVSFLLLIDRFRRGEFTPQPQFLTPVDQLLSDALSTPLNPLEHVNSRNLMSSLPWSSEPEQPHSKDDIQSRFLMDDYKPSELKCYNSKTQKFVGLTDALWRSAILTAQAVHSQKSYGCFTWVNLRPFINNNSIGCMAGPCSIIAEGISDQMTVGELEKQLRKDFNTKIKRKYYLNGMKSIMDRYRVPKPPNAFFDVSNVGYFPTNGPFVDECGRMTGTARNRNMIELTAVTTFGSENAKLALQYGYSQFVFTKREAEAAFQTFGHSLKYIGRESKIADAISELRQVIASKTRFRQKAVQ